MHMTAIGISGSPSRESRSRRLLAHGLDRLAREGTRTTLLDLCVLPADDLLGRSRSPAVADALAWVAAAEIVLVSTPVYRASYSGLLKVFFDLLPQDALRGKVAVLLATGASEGHHLAIDHALRPLLSSVGALTVSAGVYGTDGQFTEAAVESSLMASVDRAAAEAFAIAAQLHSIQR